MSSRNASRVVVEYRGKKYPGLYERNGLYYRRVYIDGKGHWPKLQATNVVDAIAEWKHLQDEENPVAPNAKRMSAFWVEFKDRKLASGKWKLGTYEKTAKPRWEQNIEPVIGSLRVQDVTAKHINRIYRLMDTEPFTTVHGRSGMYSASCKTHVRNLLQGLFDEAMKESSGPLRNSNPMTGADNPEAEKVGAVLAEDVLDTNEVEAILAELRRFSERTYLAIRLAASTGMRASEVVGLVWGDIDLTGGSITISRQLAYGASKEKTIEENRDDLKMAKAAGGRVQSKARPAYLMPDTLADLRAYRQRELEAGRFPHAEQLVFCTSNLGPVHGGSLNKPLKKAARRAGVTKPVKMHALRHFYASLQYAANPGDDAAVSADLGHTSTDFTRKRYVHIRTDAEAAARARARHAAAGIR